MARRSTQQREGMSAGRSVYSASFAAQMGMFGDGYASYGAGGYATYGAGGYSSYDAGGYPSSDDGGDPYGRAGGYPSYDNGGGPFRRNPYADRVMSRYLRTNDPYASPNRASSAEEQPRYSDRLGRLYRPNPRVTVTAPRDGQQNRNPYESCQQIRESPPPRARASGNRVRGFEEVFGDMPRPSRRSHERPQYDPLGPPRDPFTSPASVADRPYGGGSAPRHPFAPGSSLYDYERATDQPHSALQPDLTEFDDQERRRYNYYRGRVGEPWGVAGFQEYEGRRRNEERMRRYL